MTSNHNTPTSLQILNLESELVNLESELVELLLLFQQMRELKQKIKVSKSVKNFEKQVSKKRISTLDCLKDMSYPIDKKSLKSFSGLSKYVRTMYSQKFNKNPYKDGRNRSVYSIRHKNQIKKWIKEYFELNPNFWNT